MRDDSIETAAKEPASISLASPTDVRSPVKSGGEKPGDHFAEPALVFVY